jgi:hypothetical protein
MKGKPRKDHRLICYLHDDIIDLSNKLKTEVYTKNHGILVLKLDKLIKFAERAKLRGQQMEDRLSEYREAIENLGYIRKKK